MTLSGLSLPLDLDQARGLAMVFDAETADAIAAAQDGGSTRAEPRLMSDGRLVLSGDILSDVGPGGLHGEWFGRLAAPVLQSVSLVPWDSIAGLIVEDGPASVDAVPPSVTARQIRLWLVGHGVTMAAIDDAISSITDQPTRDSVRVEWEYAPYVERSHPWLVPLASALGLTEEQVDQAFREAATL